MMNPINEILDWIVKTYGCSVLVDAKVLYQNTFGQSFADEEFYETTMKHFNDFAVFTYRFQDNKTFFELYQDNVPKDQSALDSFVHSFFYVAKIKNDVLWLKDLRDSKSYPITRLSDQIFHEYMRKSICQTYVYQINDKNYLSHGAIFHPQSVNAVIKSFIKKHKKGVFNPSIEPFRYLYKSYLDFQRRRDSIATKLYQHMLNSISKAKP